MHTANFPWSATAAPALYMVSVSVMFHSFSPVIRLYAVMLDPYHAPSPVGVVGFAETATPASKSHVLGKLPKAQDMLLTTLEENALLLPDTDQLINLPPDPHTTRG